MYCVSRLSNYSRQGQRQLERSNSLTLEQKEIEAKERILNIFSMRSKIKKWKNNTNESSIFKGIYLEMFRFIWCFKIIYVEPSYKNCSPTGKTLSETDLQFCLKKTKFNRKTVLFWFKSFRKECPNGKLSRAHLYGK